MRTRPGCHGQCRALPAGRCDGPVPRRTAAPGPGCRRSRRVGAGTPCLAPLLVADYSPAERHHTAAGRTGRDLHAAVTADQIRAALQAQTHDAVPQDRADYADIHIETRTPQDDLNVLLAVARHFTVRSGHNLRTRHDDARVTRARG
ncbi:DUF6545 domain-containing protein [Streptomyces sp. NPDC050617]|uniref:DUF6545 domain-containing protein n=1 Tax=Streptomyces sp. NPDC050617 TaxID=3154628 RepID=UPI0034363D36